MSPSIERSGHCIECSERFPDIHMSVLPCCLAEICDECVEDHVCQAVVENRRMTLDYWFHYYCRQLRTVA